ncbi:MAG: hypothetical protein Q9198_001928, partial [Flavoplaca austrocitrina]
MAGSSAPVGIGDIQIYKAEYESQLDSAELGPTLLRYPTFDRFKRYITNTAGVDIGYRNMERPSADVFYFGPKPTNTACLSAVITPPPSPAPPPPSMDPSSVYVVYQPPQIFDECRRFRGGVAGPPVTKSYPSSALSSLQYRSDAPPATKAIDFADLTCPPSDVANA